MRRLSTAVFLIAFLLPGYLVAQRGRYGDRDYDRRDYDRRGPDRRGGPDRIGRVIADCEQRTDAFRGSLRRALDRSSLRDSNREDELNRDAERLERALNRVRDSWEGARDPRRTREHVSRAIEVSRDINRTMVRRRLHPDAERQWDIVRSELNRLAEVFELPRIGWR